MSAGEMVIFSGLKIDKLDDLQAMIGRGKIRTVIAAGSLAMALKKAAAELDGQQFDLGLSEDPAHKDKPYYIPRERIEQAKRMIAEGRAKGIEFVLPVDFVLQDGRVSDDDRAGQSAVRRWPGLQRAVREDGGRFHCRPQGRPPARRWSFTTACSACLRTRDSRTARGSSSPN